MTEYSIKQIKAAFKAVAPNFDDVPECSAVIAELTKPGEVFAEGQIIAIKVNSILQRARDVQTVDYSDCRALTQPEVGDSWKPADDYKMLRAEREWISVDDELPDPGKKVIVYYKNYNGLGRTIMAYHAPRWTIESDAEAETYDEYNEVLDCYYAMPGWYEQIDNWPDYASCFVNEGEITHWKPAPPEPEQNNDYDGVKPSPTSD